MSKAFFVKLENRGLIHIEGADRVDFLQGLVSNDVTQLEKQNILYSCLLTPQGKFLHDFFMHHGNDFILIDCEGGARADDLYNRLNRYRLRADIQVCVEKENTVYAVFNSKFGLSDPRHNNFCYRSFEKPDLEESNFNEWDKRRIQYGIPDGSRDMIIERSNMLECNLDQFNAIDWDKGCYMGQELTARMYHRNLGKKHLHAIEFITGSPPAPFDDIKINDKVIGQMRSSCGSIGLAMIPNNKLEELENDSHSIRLLGL